MAVLKDGTKKAPRVPWALWVLLCAILVRLEGGPPLILHSANYRHALRPFPITCLTLRPFLVADVIDLKVSAPGQTLSYETLKATLEKEKPAMLFLCQVELRDPRGCRRGWP